MDRDWNMYPELYSPRRGWRGDRGDKNLLLSVKDLIASLPKACIRLRFVRRFPHLICLFILSPKFVYSKAVLCFLKMRLLKSCSYKDPFPLLTRIFVKTLYRILLAAGLMSSSESALLSVEGCTRYLPAASIANSNSCEQKSFILRLVNITSEAIESHGL